MQRVECTKVCYPEDRFQVLYPSCFDIILQYQFCRNKHCVKRIGSLIFRGFLQCRKLVSNKQKVMDPFFEVNYFVTKMRNVISFDPKSRLLNHELNLLIRFVRNYL